MGLYESGQIRVTKVHGPTLALRWGGWASVNFPEKTLINTHLVKLRCQEVQNKISQGGKITLYASLRQVDNIKLRLANTKGSKNKIATLFVNVQNNH